MKLGNFKDVETEIRKLRQEVTASLSSPTGLSDYATKAFVTNLINSNSRISKSPTLSELDTVADQNNIIHSFVHTFQRAVNFFGPVTLESDLTVNGVTTLNGVTSINGALSVVGTADFQDDVTFHAPVVFDDTVEMNSTLLVDGAATFTSTAGFADVVTFNGDTDFNGSNNFDGDAVFNGAATFNAALTFGGAIVFNSTVKLTAVTADRPARFDASGFLVSALLDLATDITGTLDVGNGGTGATSFTSGKPIVGNGSGALTVPGTLFSGTVYVALLSGAATTKPLVISNGLVIS